MSLNGDNTFSLIFLAVLFVLKQPLTCVRFHIFLKNIHCTIIDLTMDMMFTNVVQTNDLFNRVLVCN